MIKLVTFQKRVASLTRPQFEERWLTIHGPMAARFPGLRGYMLGFSIEPGEPPADGVAQLWFDSRVACQASYASDIGRQGSADASAYLARREHLLVSEEWRRRTRPLSDTPWKLLISGKRAPAQPRAAFVDGWRGVAPELATDLGAANARLCVDEAGQLLNSKVSGALDLMEGEGVHDGMLEFWFADRASLERARTRLEPQALPAIKSIADRVEISLLREHVVTRPPQPIYD